MVRSLTIFASFLHPNGKGTDKIFAAKLHSNAVTLAEVRHKSNAIKIDQLGLRRLGTFWGQGSRHYATVDVASG